MCQFYCRTLTLFLIPILLENNSVVNNLYQTIFQEYYRIGHWITRDIYTKKKNTGKNVFVDVCLPACLFIHLFIYCLKWLYKLFMNMLLHFTSTGFHFRFFKLLKCIFVNILRTKKERKQRLNDPPKIIKSKYPEQCVRTLTHEITCIIYGGL